MPILARGGARNRADRESLHLTERQCRALIDAAERATAASLPFNRFATILWERAGVDPRAIATTTGAFVKLAADWLRPRGNRLAWAFVQEASRENNGHVHLLLHVPPAFDPLFRAMPLRWVKRLIPGRYKPGILQTQTIRGASATNATLALYSANLDRKLRYMLKAATPEAGVALGLIRRNEPSLIFGKRLCVWQRPSRH